jgi:aspartate 4-decarboxylase
MALFSLFALLDRDDSYERRCREIVRQRFAALSRGLGTELPDDPLRVAYYVDIDLEVWGRQAIGNEFADFVAAHHAPIDLVIGLAKRHGSVLLNGSGFDGPPWSVRISLANLDASAYEAIGKDLKAMAHQAVEDWRHAQRKA